jgi:competence protein ComEA
MTDCPDPTRPGDARAGSDAMRPGPAVPAAEGRVAALWQRVRSGEDPWAVGAVVVVVALAAGLLWFWAGARHAGAGVASATPGPPKANGARPGCGAAQRLGGAGDRRCDPSSDGDPASGSAAPVSGGRDPEPGDSEPGDPEPGGAAGAGRMTTGPALAVHVAGAVTHAGLYHLPPGSRVADAIAAAGGNLARADLDRLNLAAPVADGQRIYVVRRGESPPPGPLASGLVDGAGPDGEAGAPQPAGPVDLNSADLAALDSLPGIGPATARAILEERARRGGFRSTRDLLRVPGIGEGRFARLKDHVRV